MQTVSQSLPLWRASLVLDHLGNHFGVDGSSGSISNPDDRAHLMRLRKQADLIITTGKTARSENYRASVHAPIAFVSRNPVSLESLPAFALPGKFPNIVLASAAENLHWLPAKIEELGFKRPLFEGGPTSLNQLIETGVAIEVIASSVNSKLSPEMQYENLIQVVPGLVDFEVQNVEEAETMRALHLIRTKN